ncbi:hypothetical protein [Hyphomonas sp. UBA1923]|uniref:hypothetical protein n=1 Tax=Hyphomonas sp. UBA1923 TaxID=1946617 RepID=UPI0025B9194C|nr:hypothetical protein [Hyphomonas sp. UBA1923]|tara:strand:+ start:11070 stop:12227 length:1158 start_codon:yes stop_codon:yes gene_type:complete
MTDLEKIRERAKAAVSPLKPAGNSVSADFKFIFTAKRTNAGRKLPPYYLVYFLLVEVLGFRDVGQFEKVAWSVPVEYKGKAFVIEHRKFGLGVFASDPEEDEQDAAEIVTLIHRGVKAAQPYFDWMASEAAKDSKLNVLNYSGSLYERLTFFLDHYDAKNSEAKRRADERVVTKIGENGTLTEFPAFKIRKEAEHYALAAIESFFSWTEHVFIHLAILTGKCSTGEDVAKLAKADWGEKFKAALDVNDPETKKFYDDLGDIRRQLRNFIAHGAFGKDGEAFQFHSSAGAVPMMFGHRRQKRSFRFGSGMAFDIAGAITVIKAFPDHLWSGDRAPAKIYIQEHEHPLILTHVADGKYAEAMSSESAMSEFSMYLAHMMDRYANMDF